MKNKLSSTSELKKLQQKFWDEFKLYAQANYPELGQGITGAQHFYDIKYRRKYYLALTITSNTKLLACGIYIPDSPETYRKFLKNKNKISELASDLEWVAKPKNKVRVIEKSSEGNIREEVNWGQYFEWLGHNALKLQKISEKYYDLDDLVLDEEEFQELSQSGAIKVLKKGKVPRKGKVNSSSSSTWRRDPDMAYTAISNAHFQCEYNPSHQTFESAVTSQQFVEAHHLIPMEFQDKHEASIDVPENIISLCPNCHRAFHNSAVKMKIKLIEKFYKERKTS